MTDTYLVRVEWGFWSRYDPMATHRLHHSWSGSARADGGRVVRTWLIKFEGIWGPQAERLLPLQGPQWQWRPENNAEQLGGIVLEVRGRPTTRIHVDTRTVNFAFTIGSLERQRIVRRHIGHRYSGESISAMLDGCDPNLDRPEDLKSMTAKDGHWRALVHARQFDGPVRRWYRADWVWIAPGASTEARIPVPRWTGSSPNRSLAVVATVHAIAAVPKSGDRPFEEIDEGETDTTWIRLSVALNGKAVFETNHHFGAMGWIRGKLPYKEEIHVMLPWDGFHQADNSICIRNLNSSGHLLVARVHLEALELSDIEIAACPAWVLLGQPFEIVVVCRSDQSEVRFELPAGLVAMDALPSSLPAGEHRIRLQALEPLSDVEVVLRASGCEARARIDCVSAVVPEEFTMRVGVEDNCFPATHPELEEQILRQLKDRQLGDFVVIRREDVTDLDRVLQWVGSAREKGIHQMISMSIGGHWRTRDDIAPVWGASAWREGRELATGFVWDEHDGPLWNYLVNPRLIKVSVPESERTMRTACEDYRNYLARLVAMCRQAEPRMPSWLRISTVGHSYAYAAGMDGCLTQLNKSHNTLLIADARGGGREYGGRRWGAYIAEGAHMNPEGEEHLRMWELALNLSYICGASFANDEECLFRSWHSHQYSWSDRLPRLRQEILGRFNRYVKTHPRTGKLRVKQALLTGRYSCDVVDGFCGSEGPWVWSNFGARRSEWRPLTPEYGLRYLDTFLPGVWLQSLEQSPERTRRLYSGTPYGELEVVSVDAPSEVLSQYPLLLMLGWNTMDRPTYDRLRSYVETGGRLFMSVPHLTTNESRSFLTNNMEPLNLLNAGDLSALFGVKIAGRGPRLGGIRAEGVATGNPLAGRSYASIHGNYLPTQRPIHPPVDLADVELKGADVVAADASSGRPVVTRHSLGRGEAYLLTTWEYPGNSRLSDMMSDLVAGLAESVPTELSVADPSGDVYYTVRDDERIPATRVHLVNTDWTEADNERRCLLRVSDEELPIAVPAGRIVEIVVTESIVVGVDDQTTHVEHIAANPRACTLRLHGYGRAALRIHGLKGRKCVNPLISGSRCTTTRCGPWLCVRADLGGRTTGTLEVQLR